MSGLLRGGALTLFAGTSVHLLRRDNPVEENDCVDPQARIGCPSCLEWNGCKLPRALSVKQFLNQNKDGQKQNT